MIPKSIIPTVILMITACAIKPTNLITWVSSSTTPVSIYDALVSNGLPLGLIPKGVNNYTIDKNGYFQVCFNQTCNAKFESELHYDLNVSGKMIYGEIRNLSGILAKDLFLWFPVKEIRVDIPSSGVIYFDVGVVYKQFSLSLFEIPPNCVAAVEPSDELPKISKKFLQHPFEPRTNQMKIV